MPPFFKSQIGGWFDPKTSSDTSSLSVGIMADDHQPFLGTLTQPTLDGCGRCAGLQYVRRLQDGSRLQHFGNDLGRRAGPRQRAGNDPVKIHAKRAQSAGDLAHAFFAFGSQGPLIVRDSRRSRLDGDPMSDDVEIDHQLVFPDQRLSRTRALFPARRFLTVNAQSQALRTSAGLDELAEAEQSHAEAPFTQLLGQLGAPSFKITVLPTTTALQLNDTASSTATSIKPRNAITQHRAPIFVERAGIIEGNIGRERAKARVEMVEARVDQLERQDLHAQPLADPLVAAHVATKSVARDKRLTAKQRVAGPFKIVSSRELDDLETPALRPGFKIMGFPLPDSVPEPRADEEIAKDQAGICSEYQVGKPRHRLDQVHGRSQITSVW